MIHYKYVIFFLLFLLFFASPVFASEKIGTIDSNFKYTWGESLGWINFKPNTAGLTITDTSITGYVWSKDFGWINFSPGLGGVTNNCAGQLGGSAWSSQKGWLSLTGVAINSGGKFTGLAGVASSSAGRITFDCSKCDVRTDWRPCSTRLSSAGGYSSTGSVSNVSNPASNFVKSVNQALVILPGQFGVLIEETSLGEASLNVPPDVLRDKTTFSIIERPGAEGSFVFNGQTVNLVGGVFFDVIARDSKGRLVHNFNSPLTISLPVPADLVGVKGLGVFWLDETKDQWVKIPRAVFSGNQVTFSVDHLTRFAIFKYLAPKNFIQNLIGEKEPATEELPATIGVKENNLLNFSSTTMPTKLPVRIPLKTPVKNEEGQDKIVWGYLIFIFIILVGFYLISRKEER